jgi:diguanylate cyclase (GGDEF)-like protein
MNRFDKFGVRPAEEIEGAPPAVSEEELQQQRLEETVQLNRYLYEQVQQLEYQLFNCADLQSLLELLLVSLPREFSFPACELWLYDPEDALQDLIANRHRYGRNLQLFDDNYELNDLYHEETQVTFVDAADVRMFKLLKSEQQVDHVLVIPLKDSGVLIGSLHWGLKDGTLWRQAQGTDILSHLAGMLSISFRNAVSRQRLAQLNLVDLHTEIGNRRAFEQEVKREISRARRDKQPLALMLVQVDEYQDLRRYHGLPSSEYVMRKVAERISQDLRTTDRLARLSDAGLAVLLPGSNEVSGKDIAERMRETLDTIPVDDGRGAVMHTTVSIGLAVWEPQRYPAVDMKQLAVQLEAAAGQGLFKAIESGGNKVVISRISTLII